MPIKFTSFAVVGALGLSLAFAAPAMAQDADHIAAAKSAIAATTATSDFDLILPRSADALKKRLSGTNPDKADEIDAIVDEQALALAPRRGDLENEAANLFAASFSKDELQAIADFFATDTGKKYLSTTPILARELSKAARIWRDGIQRDLSQNSTEALNK